MNSTVVNYMKKKKTYGILLAILWQVTLEMTYSERSTCTYT